MGFFTPRERRELEKPETIAEFIPSRRFRNHDLADNADSIQRVAHAPLQHAPLQQIDDLIADLHMRREKLLSESERVQREVIEYAKLSQTTMASTKIVTEALSSWRTTPGGFGASEASVRDDHVDGNATPEAPHDGDAEVQSDNP